MGFGWSFYGFFRPRARGSPSTSSGLVGGAPDEEGRQCAATPRGSRHPTTTREVPMVADSTVFPTGRRRALLLVLGISIWGYLRATSEDEFLAAGRTIGRGWAVRCWRQRRSAPGRSSARWAATTSPASAGRGSGSASGLAGRRRRCSSRPVSAASARSRSPTTSARASPARGPHLAAALIVVTYTILLTAQFQAIGEIASAVFGMAPMAAMALLLASTGVYTALGGVRASSYVEFIQTLIMVLALVGSVPVVLTYVGGLTALGEYVGSIDPRVTGWWFPARELVSFGIAFGFGIAAAPYEMTRYYSMRDVATVRYAIGISMLFQVVIGSSVTILGIGIRGIYPYLPSPDQASSLMAATVMPPILGSLFLVAMLSAIMSTVNSILLVTGGACAHDLYKRLVHPQASQRRLVWVTRISIVALGILPFWLATLRLGDVQAIVVEQAKFIASFFFVPVVLGLNWRRGTRQGAIWSMAAGFAACLAWTFTLQASAAAHGIDAVEVGVATSALVFIVVSRMTPPTPAANLAIFFGDGAPHPGRTT
ncbi:MAG: sodium:solute symporter family protein [Vicinamibacterales bacterium]